jgi:hypothetical protein
MFFKIVTKQGPVIRDHCGVSTTSNTQSQRFPAVWEDRATADTWARQFFGLHSHVVDATETEFNDQYRHLYHC